MLTGAGGMILSALLPWVTIRGIGLDLGLIGAEVSPGSRTVHGTDTSIWPAIVAVAAVIAVLGLLNLARKLLLGLGLLAIAAGAALVYYTSNIVELELGGGSAVRQRLVEELILSDAGPGPVVLLASGVVVVLGVLLSR